MVKMGYVWDRAAEFLGDHLSRLLPIAILAMFVPAALSGSLEELRQTGAPGVRMGLGALQLVFGILSLWAQLAIAALAIDPGIGRRMTAVATARLLPAIGVYLLVAVVFGVLCLPIVAMIIASGIDVSAMGAGRVDASAMAPGYGLGLGLYGLALMIALLFVGARLMPLSAVIVAERRGAGAVPHALRLTRGLTWRLVGVIVLYVVVSSVAVLAAQTVFGSVLRIVAGGDGPVTVGGVVTATVVAAVSTALSVLAAAFAAKLYVAVARVPETVAATFE